MWPQRARTAAGVYPKPKGSPRLTGEAPSRYQSTASVGNWPTRADERSGLIAAKLSFSGTPHQDFRVRADRPLVAETVRQAVLPKPALQRLPLEW